MKKSLKLFTFISIFSLLVTACGNNNDSSNNGNTSGAYTITWKNYDGEVLEIDSVEEGILPTYDGDTPTKPSDDDYNYTFTGWTPDIKPATSDQTYTAIYSSEEIKYTITWENYNGEVLKIDEVKKGIVPTYNGVTPSKPSDDNYIYTFTGWTPEIKPATKNQTYTATYSSEEISYTITWKNYDGTVLETDNVKKGIVPTYDGATPTKPSDDDYNYIFSGWTPEVEPASNDQTYTAIYSSEEIKYTIDFDLNGGTSPSYAGPQIVESFTKDIFFFDCVKEDYNFRGWSYKGTRIFDEKGNLLENPSMEKSMTFVAEYSQTAKLSIISNLEGAAEIVGEGEYSYNTYVDVSVRTNKGYVFIGWYYQNTLLSNTENYKYMMWSDDIILEARFKLDNYNLRIYSNNENNGLVLIKGANYYDYYSSSYSRNYDYKTKVTIVAYSNNETRFLGWYDQNNALVETNAVYSFTMPNEDLVLEAKWNYFTVSYNLNGGINDPSNPSSYTVEDNITLNEPTKNGYVFLGWFDENDKQITVINASTIRHLTLTAKWTGKQNNLSVTSEDETKGSAEIISGSGISDETITVKATPIKDYAFKGWYHQDTVVSYEPTYSFVMPLNDYSLVAHFFTVTEQQEEIKYAKRPFISEDGTTITYGLYPQTNVNDSSLIEALNNITTPEDNGWYLYNGEYYAKTDGKPYENDLEFNNETIIVKGTMYWFKCEPIIWDVLSNDNGEYYIVSSVLLDAHCYYSSPYERKIDGKTIYANNYQYSDIRAWLNGDFYNSAFALGNRHVQLTTVDNSASTTNNSSNSYACENTSDNVFLPSYMDYTNTSYGFDSTVYNAKRKCKTTDWARARGARFNIDYRYGYDYGLYWTRSPNATNDRNAFYVYADGGLYNDNGTTLSGTSVRPAIKVKLL